MGEALQSSYVIVGYPQAIALQLASWAGGIKSVAACGGVCALAGLVSALSGCAALPFSNSRPSKALGCVQAYAMLSTRAAAPAAFKRLPP